MTRILFGAYFLETGLILVVMPWSTFWDRNLFVVMVPALERLLGSAYARGAVSGVGVITAAAGILELALAFAGRRVQAPHEPRANV